MMEKKVFFFFFKQVWHWEQEAPVYTEMGCGYESRREGGWI